jgi:hypothetical protein
LFVVVSFHRPRSGADNGWSVARQGRQTAIEGRTDPRCGSPRWLRGFQKIRKPSGGSRAINRATSRLSWHRGLLARCYIRHRPPLTFVKTATAGKCDAWFRATPRSSEAWLCAFAVLPPFFTSFNPDSPPERRVAPRPMLQSMPDCSGRSPCRDCRPGACGTLGCPTSRSRRRAWCPRKPCS